MNPDLSQRLHKAGQIEPGVLADLTAAVAADGDADLDLAYRVLPSPIGDLLLVATQTGLVRVAFAVEDHEAVLVDVAARISPRILAAPRRLDPAAYAFEAYFAGQSRSFAVPLDRQLSGTGYRAQVQELLSSIGYGTTASYAALAAASGRPAAVRAVGTACATNPLPIVVPCHRIVRSDGTFGNYLGGHDAKAWLLNFEQSQRD